MSANIATFCGTCKCKWEDCLCPKSPTIARKEGSVVPGEKNVDHSECVRREATLRQERDRWWQDAELMRRNRDHWRAQAEKAVDTGKRLCAEAHGLDPEDDMGIDTTALTACLEGLTP